MVSFAELALGSEKPRPTIAEVAGLMEADAAAKQIERERKARSLAKDRRIAAEKMAQVAEATRARGAAERVLGRIEKQKEKDA